MILLARKLNKNICTGQPGINMQREMGERSAGNLPHSWHT